MLPDPITGLPCPQEEPHCAVRDTVGHEELLSSSPFFLSRLSASGPGKQMGAAELCGAFVYGHSLGGAKVMS